MDFAKMRPFQIIMMVVFGLLAVVGLFLFANYSGFNGGQRVVGSVTIWGTVPQEPMRNALRDLIDRHKEYGNVKYVGKNPATFDAELAEALASGTGPDLLILSQEQLLAHTNKIITIPYSSISERTFKDSYVPIFDLFLSEEGTYGIPFAVDPLVLFYNAPMLETVGVAEAPRTWEAVTGLSALLTKKSPDQSVTKSLIALGEYDNVTNARAIVSLLLLQSGSTVTGETSNGLRSTLASAGGTFGMSPAESAMNFYTQFANPTKTVYSWNRAMRESRQAFTTGDVALYLGFASELSILKAGNPNLTFDMAAVPQPQTADFRTTYGLAYAFTIPKASKNSSGAYDVATTLAGKGMAPTAAIRLGMAPALRSALTPPKDHYYAPVFYPEALIAKGWLSPAPSSTDSIFSTMISDITTGRRNVRDALYVADQALDAAI